MEAVFNGYHYRRGEKTGNICGHNCHSAHNAASVHSRGLSSLVDNALSSCFEGLWFPATWVPKACCSEDQTQDH